MDGLINQMQESFYSINVYQNQVVHLSIISINLEKVKHITRGKKI